MPISTIGQNGLNAPLSLTSPALTTPNLGTPSAINLSNATALAKAALPTGSVLQVVNATYTTETSTTSSSYVDTGWTFSITPTFSTSKIFIVARVTSRVIGYAFGSLQFVRGASTVLSPAPATAYETGITTGSADLRHVNSYVYLDSPATTSLVTYKVQMIAFSGYQYIVYPSNNPASVVMMEIAA